MRSPKDEFVRTQLDTTFKQWIGKAALLGSALIMVPAWIDYFANAEHFAQFLLYRLLIALFLILGYILAKKELSLQLLQVLAVLWIVACTMFIEYTLVQAEVSEGRYVIGNIVLIIIVTGFIPARIRHVTLLAVLMYLIVLVPILSGAIKLNNYRLLFVNLYVLMIVFSMLVLRHLSEKSVIRELEMKYDLDQYRKGLEREVASRTHALNQTVTKLQEEISARRAVEEQLHHDAIHDFLTGLANRALFNDRLSHAIVLSGRHTDYHYAVLFLDLDHFKVINDGLGHIIGDQLLIDLGQRLAACVRPQDTVARLGGDEFAILLEDIGDIGNAISIVERVRSSLGAPCTLAGREVTVTVSIGIALSGGAYQHPDQILRDADTAMYKAKARGRNQYVVFEPSMHEHAVARLHLELDLRKAVERNEFPVFYQPILSFRTNTIVGFEALARWHHPERGLLYPKDFIRLADETGMIVAIDRLVLREACRQMRDWLDRYSGGGLTFISTNLSNRQMAQPDLVEHIEEVLSETGLKPNNLKVEITEEVIIKDPKKMSSLMARIQALGVQIYIDDFGTGYSSLSYLHRLPINGIKIDRSFIEHSGDTGDNREIIRTIMMLSDNLNIDVIAEGVEKMYQLEQIKSMGCHQGQGYLFSRPVSGERAGAMLEEKTIHAQGRTHHSLVNTV